MDFLEKAESFKEDRNLSEKIKRILMTVFGVSICGCSVGLFHYSMFGMDPFQVFAHGLWMALPDGWMHYGTFYAVLCFGMLCAVFFADRKKIGLGTVINLFLVGYISDFSNAFLEAAFPGHSLVIRMIFLVLGIVIMCFASSLYFTADLGVSVYDAVALILTEKRGWNFKICRVTGDLLCTLIGFAFGATVGIGTLITAFFMGPLIAFFNRTVAIPLRYGKRAAGKR